MGEAGNDHPAPTIVAGAQIRHKYLVRTQRTVAVNATDLSELLTFDAVHQGLLGVGLFFVSGGAWLGFEKVFEQETFALTPAISFCLVSVVAGLALMSAGFVIWLMRRSKIRKIFSETSETE